MAWKGSERNNPGKHYFAYGVVAGAGLSVLVSLATGRMLAGGLFALLALVVVLLRHSGERRAKRERERRNLR